MFELAFTYVVQRSLFIEGVMNSGMLLCIRFWCVLFFAASPGSILEVFHGVPVYL